MHTISDPDSFRTNIVNSLNDLIKNEKISRNLEKGIYNYSIKDAALRAVVKKWDNPYFVQLYIDRLRSIYFNINTTEILITQLKEKKLKPSELAFMTHQEINPEKWNVLIEKKKGA